MAETQDEQGAADRHHRIECTSRWWQGGAGGGARVVGGMDRTDSGGDRVEEEGQEAMAGDGANSGEGMVQGLGARQGLSQGGVKAGGMGEGEPWLLLAMFGHTYYPLLIVNLLIYLIRIIFTKKRLINHHRVP